MHAPRIEDIRLQFHWISGAYERFRKGHQVNVINVDTICCYMYSRVCFLLSRSSVHLEALDRRCSSSLQLLGYHLNYVKIDWLPWQWCSCAYGPSCKWSKQNMPLPYACRPRPCHFFDSCNPIFPRIWSYCPTVLSLRPMFPIKRIEREPMFVSLMVSFTAHLKQSYGSD